WDGTQIPSPPFRGEREGPSAERWEGRVAIGERSGIPHLTPTLAAPRGGEGVDLAADGREFRQGNLCLIDHDAADRFAGMHQVEALVDVVERELVGDQLVDLDLAFHV